MKFRKKPVVIEAYHFTGPVLEDECPKWLLDAFTLGIALVSYVFDEGVYEIEINTLQGVLTANEGDWIIKGVNGEVYPCKPNIFEKTYERVEHND